MQSVGANDLDRRVLQAEGPVVLDFYQATCPPCRVLEPRLERIARAYEDRLSTYRVDIDQDLSIAERFDVQSIPTVVFLRGGEELARLDGLITDQDLIAAFERVSGAVRRAR